MRRTIGRTGRALTRPDEPDRRVDPRAGIIDDRAKCGEIRRRVPRSEQRGAVWRPRQQDGKPLRGPRAARPHEEVVARPDIAGIVDRQQAAAAAEQNDGGSRLRCGYEEHLLGPAGRYRQVHDLGRPGVGAVADRHDQSRKTEAEHRG